MMFSLKLNMKNKLKLADTRGLNMKKSMLLVIVILVSILLQTGCMPSASKADNSGLFSNSTKAWFDFPVNGMTMSIKPYELVAHVTNPDGISEVEWIIEDEVVFTSSADMASSVVDNLYEFHYMWDVVEPGEQTINIRPKAADGSWGLPASVTVFVEGEMTPAPEDTPTHTPTATSTATPTETPAPLPDILSVVETTRSSDSFFNGNCAPNQITFRIRVTKPEDVTYLFMFYKLQDKESGKQTEYNEGTAMKKVSDDTWEVTIKSSAIQDSKKYKESWLIYQFVVQSGKSASLRSKPLGDVSLLSCGSQPEIVDPTPGVIIINPWE